MQYLVAINQTKALEWGLNAQQAMLFAFLHQVPTWADARQIDGHTFYNCSKTKIVAELPLLTDKPDTAYRLLKQLAGVGVIEITSCDNRTYVRLTPKGKTWNRVTGSEKFPTLDEAADSQGSEKNPTSEKSPSRVGKTSEPGSEKSPTNQDTNDPNPSLSDAGDVFERAAQLDDDGQPVPDNIGNPAAPGDKVGVRPAADRKHPMTLDWEPDPALFAAQCYRAGLSPETSYEPHQLAKFVAHHAGDPARQYAPAGWIGRFVDWIRNDRLKAQSQPKPIGGAHANGRQRTPARRLTAAEARERDRQQREQQAGGQCFDGEWRSGH